MALVASSCTDNSDAGDLTRFCAETEANIEALTAPELSFSDDVDALLELYREVGQYAPLSIEREWEQLIVNYETASTVVPGDDESMQRAIAEALRSETSAVIVRDWLRTNCSVDFGPVDTVAPQGN